jgi:hypothetical protein
MDDCKIVDSRVIDAKEKELDAKYPMEANFGSKCSLWSRGLYDGLVTSELYESAGKYYGHLWTYAGD